MKKAGLKMNHEKSKFCRKEVKYLGFIVNGNGLLIDPEETKTIKNYPQPKKLRQVLRFIGMTSWYSKFIKDYAKIFETIKKLVKKDMRFHWEKEQGKVFIKLKETLADTLMLHRPTPGAEYFVHLEACDTGLGAMLRQKIDSVGKVLAHATKALKDTQKVYSTAEKECLAKKWAIEIFSGYIEGEALTVITDHSMLR